MKVLARQFNFYLALAALAVLAGGCQTGKKQTPTAAVRVHIASSPDPAGDTVNISVLRDEPVLITVRREPLLTEANLLSAKVIEAQGGFALELKFDETGTRLLEQYSASNQGSHFAIWAEWSENDFSLFTTGDFISLPSLASQLQQPTNAVSAYLKSRLSATTLGFLANFPETNASPDSLQTALVGDLNRIIQGPSVFDAPRFAGIVLRPVTRKLLAQNPAGANLVRLNRLLLEDAYPKELTQNRKKAINSRWLAAPVISRRNASGALVFTADCSRQEADELAAGLNETAKIIQKKLLK